MGLDAPLIEALLAPISNEAPCGRLVRRDPVFAQLEEARREDRDLPSGVWQTDRKRADLDRAIDLATKILTRHSKDLLVAAWLVEAALRRDGLESLASLFEFLAALVDRWAADLFPEADGEDQSPRALVFEWLDERLHIALLTLPLTTSLQANGPRYSLSDYRQALRLEGTNGAQPKGGEPRIALKDFRSATSATSHGSLRATYLAARAALESVHNLARRIDDRYGGEMPGLLKMRDALEGLRHWSRTELDLRGDRVETAPEAEQPPQTKSTSQGEDVAPAITLGPPIKSRHDAYQRLEQIAQYLNRAEPHSPTPYLLNRIIQWRDLPLPDLLIELSRGRRDFGAIFELIGFRDEKASP